MRVEQLGVQLYTLRDYLKTHVDIASSLKRVRQIGYRCVQVSGIGPIEDDELIRILEGEGLICCATHEPADKIIDNPKAVVERLNKLDCRYTAYPYPSGVDFSSVQNVVAFTRKLDAAGKVLREADKVLAYHNHSIEFQRIDGRLILELIYQNSNPDNLQAELDTYWVQHGGADPAEWCRKLKGRLPLIHMKDYVIIKSNVPAFAEVGSGNLNWKNIITEAENAGCRWFLVEQDDCAGCPFESLEKSFKYITKTFCN
jgi:sugar phosphate isomerase/epimerase